MNINLQIENFRKDLYDLIANSDLPISIVYYIYKNIGQELENTYLEVIDNLTKQNQQQENEQEPEVETQQVEEQRVQ